MQRVVITGAGTVNALALDVPGTLRAMREGRCGIGPLDIPDLDRLQVRIGAQITGWDAEARFSRVQLGLYDRFTQFALVAGQEAMSQAGLRSVSNPLKWGCIMGTAGGGNSTVNDAFHTVFAEGKSRVHPFTVPRLMNNAAASHLSMTWNLQGPCFSVATACASSNHAIGLAYQMIRSGMAEGMLAGGSESMLNFGGLKAWEGLRVMSRTGCRPFAKSRDGMVQGEGGAVFVLESLESAKARDASILAEICGFSMTSDAGDIVMPSLEGATRAISGALADGGIAADRVGYINAHGTGTAANDKTESAAIRSALGTQADYVLVSSTKAMHGHCIGGTGAIEVLACLMALNEGVIAPTINHDTPDPDCDLDVVPNEAREASIDIALSNAFAFGGMNAVLALKRI
ncbi:beta-ketoacyl-[acyl-carrier-protein] synthase family protein [Thioclava sp. 'Guangxiensis']|uniref:beta-ketoacyl-[acyl-carrier-protein] synthase family protein n=1 Tax=Thioclava sp. 'Guangxiensis' TaxID=3149044 RepID=UPI003877AB70